MRPPRLTCKAGMSSLGGMAESKEDRLARQAAALRENLLRRKAQARSRREEPKPEAAERPPDEEGRPSD